MNMEGLRKIHGLFEGASEYWHAVAISRDYSSVIPVVFCEEILSHQEGGGGGVMSHNARAAHRSHSISCQLYHQGSLIWMDWEK
jgi:hypothetical protein